MPTYAELLTDIYTVTNRPDLVAETKYYLKNIVAQLHAVDNFYPDRRSMTISAGGTDAYIPFTSLITPLPAPENNNSYVRSIEECRLNETKKPLTHLDVFDDCTAQKTNTWKLTGGQGIQFYLSDDLPVIEVVYYIGFAPVDETWYDQDWLVQKYSPGVIAGTAAKIFGSIGLQEEKREQLTEYGFWLSKIEADNLEEVQR